MSEQYLTHTLQYVYLRHIFIMGKKDLVYCISVYIKWIEIIFRRIQADFEYFIFYFALYGREHYDRRTIASLSLRQSAHVIAILEGLL